MPIDTTFNLLQNVIKGTLFSGLDYIVQNFLDRANAFVVDSRLLHNLSLTVLPLGKHCKLTFEAKNITDTIRLRTAERFRCLAGPSLGPLRDNFNT